MAHTCVFVDKWPEQAFGAFVEEVGVGFDGVDWWWIQPDRGRYLRIGSLDDSLVVEAWDAIGAERHGERSSPWRTSFKASGSRSSPPTA